MISAAIRTELECWVQRGGVRKALRSLLIYAFPALFVQLFLTKLGGGALFLPDAWRKLVILVGVVVGQACFNLARSNPARRLHPRLDGELTPGGAPLAAGRPSRRARRQAVEREVEQRRLSHARNTSVVPWLVVGVLFVAAQVLLRVQLVVPFEVPGAVVERTALSDAVLPYFMASEGTSRRELLAGDTAPSSGLALSVLLPLWIGNDASQAQIAAVEREKGVCWIRHYMNNDPEEVSDILDGEKLGMAMTILAFALVHVGLVVSFSTAYGLMFSIPEECGAAVGELLT